jgi:hypothetical protein
MADFTAPRRPLDPNKVLSAYNKASNSTTPVNVLTVPAGRTWTGSVSIIASSQSATAVLADTRAVTAGTGVLPAAGTIIGVSQCDRDTTSTVVMVPDVVVAAPAGNAVTIDVVNSTATTYIGGVSCFGYLD